MSIGNGGIIGKRNVPSLSGASGMWLLEEVHEARQAGIWPTGGDPFWSQVKLLLKADGTDGSTSIIDSSSAARTVTVNGNAQIDTAQSKFGGASLLLDGTGDYVTVPDSSDWDFGTGDFTIDLWARFNSLSSTPQHILVHGAIASTGIALMQYSGTTVRIYTQDQGSGMSYSWTPSTNTWYHLAAVRSAGVVTFYVDGVSKGTNASTKNITGATGTLRVGTSDNGNESFNGWLDDVRITAAARWTTDFTPPVAPAPAF